MNSSWRKVLDFLEEKQKGVWIVSFEGTQGVCHPGSGDGGIPHMLASFLPLVSHSAGNLQVALIFIQVPNCNDMWGGMSMPTIGGRHTLLDW